MLLLEATQGFLPYLLFIIKSEPVLLALFGFSLILVGSFVHMRNARHRNRDSRQIPCSEPKEAHASMHRTEEQDFPIAARRPRIHAGLRGREADLPLQYWNPSDTAQGSEPRQPADLVQ
jgi:hypothetical protein